MTILKIFLFILVQALVVLLYKLLKTEKNGLFKNLLFMVFEVVILTWFIPASYFDSGELNDLGMYRVGFFDFFQLLFGTFEFSYFIQILILLISVGALYGVLGKTGKYRAWIEKIANNLKGKELIFTIVTAILIATITSVFDYGLVLFIFIPLLISIILAMGYDKFTAFLVTFGAMLVGSIGSTIGYNTAGVINEAVSATLSNAIYFRIGLFVFALAALIFFISKAKRSSKREAMQEDKFIGEKNSNKFSVLPIIVIFLILFVLMVLGCTNWTNTFNVSAFTNLNTSFTELTIGDFEVSSIVGTISEFGKWYYAEMATMCLIAALIIARFYKMKHSDTLSYMAEGAKKILPTALLIVMCYSVIYFAGNTMFYTTIANYILNFTDGFNIFFSTIVMALGSLLHVDMLYVGNYVLPMLTSQTVNTQAISLLIQGVHGVTMLVAPTSAVLVLGLSYLNIPYTEWIKKIWKLVVALLVLVIIVILLAMYI